jgi:hypothetical protein
VRVGLVGLTTSVSTCSFHSSWNLNGLKSRFMNGWMNAHATEYGCERWKNPLVKIKRLFLISNQLFIPTKWHLETKGSLLSTHELFITPWVVEKLREGFEKPGRFFWNLCELKRTVRSSFETSKKWKPTKTVFQKSWFFYKIDLNFMSVLVYIIIPL